MLKGKTVILGVTGGIAAYKSAYLARLLMKHGADVEVIMTKNAANFISPLTFETLTGNRCITDSFARDFKYDVKHIALAKRADVLLIAPATANVIAKISHGIADDMLTATALSCGMNCTAVAPAMNERMYNNPITQENIKHLTEFGCTVITPARGLLACGDYAIGALPPEDFIIEHVIHICFNKDMQGKKVLVTAGATAEPLDPVRFLTNRSTGKMGCAVARAAMLRGADVTLIAGKMSVPPPYFVNVINVETAAEMFETVKNCFKDYDIIIKAAAVSDYRPVQVSKQKIKSGSDMINIEMTKNADILEYIGKNKQPGQFICGFSMETENLTENSRLKLINKNADMIVANSLTTEGAGFAEDTNIVTVITQNGNIKLPKMPKFEVAMEILRLI
ncbi:MAG: bifunctional phosphopantothenoylcysteine decarboxylase/phosphopantothenate--cysteine ligase CoaBC [Oscillospiraceae bacterium]|jgi:phosphopantothenoylcysteine decarboxylase/phosphopantothenate--cysteine ligase|nr:bifunctional phosphopantothenoylcysteine decarboxylase/phosphopantothenate--cysteine ligase CoaBC [Oscillospiraceae bacterium]